MIEEFDIRGLFYEQKGLECRKYLDIRRKTCLDGTPDLFVIMMNPGKSRPAKGGDHHEKEVIAIPDRTQVQIMRVMKRCGFGYARILNLSDVRESNSHRLFELLPSLESDRVPHSIFDPKREQDLEELFTRETPVILAWGVDKSLHDLAGMALKKIGTESVYGIKKQGEDFAYYHPLPPDHYKQQDWVNRIADQLKNSRVISLRDENA